MANERQYEMAAAYVAILPSLAGLREELRKQLEASMPSFKETMRNGLNSAMSGAMQNMGSVMTRSGSAFTTVGRLIGTSLTTSISRAGTLFKDTMMAGARTAGTALVTAVAAVGGKVVTGGFSRALALNKADAKLQALGLSAQRVSDVMGAASRAVNGSAYNMAESVTAATQFLSAGVTNTSDLEKSLRNVGKLADISGRTFGEMGSLMSKNAASGIVQWEDLIQLIQAGIPIQVELAKMLGKTPAEIKKMASESKITYEQLEQAVSNIKWDSAVYAAKNIELAWGNLMTALDKIGAAIWDPIFKGLTPVINKVKGGLNKLLDNVGFNDFVNKFQSKIAVYIQKLDVFATKISTAMGNDGQVRKFFTTIVEGFEKFRTAIDGVEGPLAGIILAFGNNFLDKLPVVGALFEKIGPKVGIFGGALFQMYNDSDLLQGSIKKLGDTFSRLFESLTGGGGTEFFKTIGDGLSRVLDAINGVLSGIGGDLKMPDINFAGVINSIFNSLAKAIKVVGEHGGEIKTVFSELFTSITDLFGKVDPKSGEAFGQWLGEVLVKTIVLAGEALKIAVPILVGAIGGIGAVVMSDAMMGLFSWLVDVAHFLAEHEGALKVLGGILAALFIGNKLRGPLMATVGFFKSFGGVASAASGPVQAVTNTFADAIIGFFKAMGKIAKTVGKTFKTVTTTVGDMVTSVADLIATIIKSLGPIIKSAGKLLVTIFKVLGQVGAAMINGLAAIGQAITKGVVHLAALGLFILAVGGIVWLLEKMDFFEIIQKFTSGIIELLGQLLNMIIDVAIRLVGVIGQVFTMVGEALKSVWSGLEPILTWLKDAFLEVFTVVGDMVLKAVPVITQAIDDLTATLMGALEISTGLLDQMIRTLAEHGIDAGAGALAAAGGITALAGAIALLGGASLLHDIASGIGSLWASFVEGITGDNVSAVSQLTAMGEAIQTFDAGVSTMPDRWAQVGSTAYQSGWSIMQSFTAGMTDAIVTMEAAITAALMAMIQRLQAQVNAMPINLQVSAPSMGVAAGANVYNNSTNYDVTVNNSSVLKSLAMSAR